MEETAAPYAEPLWRRVYALRRDLSSDPFLEERRPAPLVQVFTVEIAPGGEAALERLLTAARAAGASRFAAYQPTDGGPLDRWLLLAPRRGLRELTGLIGLLGQGGAEAWARIRQVESETWHYRADLTYLPDR